VKDAKVAVRLLELQLRDEDSDPSNGIKLNADVKTALAAKTADFNAAADAFNTALSATLTAAGAKYAARSVDDSRRELVQTLEDTLASVGAPVNETFTRPRRWARPCHRDAAQVQAASSYYIPYEGTNASKKTSRWASCRPGSSLAFKGTNANGELEFYGLTDRGPNGDGPNLPALTGSGVTGAKIFPSPSFAPAFGVITVGKNGAVLTSSTPIKASANVKASGLAIPPARWAIRLSCRCWMP
jgi:hypothetical protein